MNWIAFMSPPQVPGMLLWGAISEPWQYVISYDREFGTWAASVKRLPDEGPLIPLGHEHATRFDAEEACERHRMMSVML